MNEVDMLQQSLDDMDRSQPGWDSGAYLAACKAGLKDGVNEKALRQIYGNAVVEDAKRLTGSNVVDDVVFVEPMSAGVAVARSERTHGRVVGFGHISDANEGLLKAMHVGAEVEVVPEAGSVSRAVLNGKRLLAVGIAAISLTSSVKG